MMCNCHPETCCCDPEKDEYMESLEQQLSAANKRIAEQAEEIKQYAQDVLTLLNQLRCCIGIAERGAGRKVGEDETGEVFLLEYVKGLEAELTSLRAYKEECEKAKAVAWMVAMQGDNRATLTYTKPSSEDGSEYELIVDPLYTRPSPDLQKKVEELEEQLRKAGRKEAVPDGKFKLGDHVRKTKGSRWQGKVVGYYSTTLTPEGYAVESDTEIGSVQIYPAAALELVAASKPKGT